MDQAIIKTSKATSSNFLSIVKPMIVPENEEIPRLPYPTLPPQQEPLYSKGAHKVKKIIVQISILS